MPAIIAFVDGSTITVPRTANEVTDEMQRMASGHIREAATHFNRAHVVHGRDTGSSGEPMAAFR